MRGDTLLKDIIEGTIKGKKQSGRSRCKTLDWIMNRDDGYTYQNLKEMTKREERLRLQHFCNTANTFRKLSTALGCTKRQWRRTADAKWSKAQPLPFQES